MLAVTFAPVPVACTSRMRPPVPVSAPGKGATPEGKLCVSADSRMCDMNFCCTNLEGRPGCSGWMVEISKPRMAEELSLKAMTLFLRRSSVSASLQCSR